MTTKQRRPVKQRRRGAPLTRPTISAIGASIRSARNRIGLTQSAAAKKAGVSQGLWSDVEAGKVPRFPTLSAMGCAVGLSAVKLLRLWAAAKAS